MDLLAKTILVVDDKPANTAILRNILIKAGYSKIYCYHDAIEVKKQLRIIDPDVILLDLHMPDIDGLELLEWIDDNLFENEYLPTIILTADERADVKRRALQLGAKDFLAKPFDSVEILLRVRNLLETREIHQQLKGAKARINYQLEERTKQLEDSQIEMLVRLAKAAEYKDDDTGEHVWRVAQTSTQIAKTIGLEEHKTQMLMRAARLHDLGKLCLPEGIILKAGSLNKNEFDIVKEHTTYGANLLSGSQSELIQMAESIALNHHENWDGTGYPNGLKAEEIPIESRILAVADAFDAMTHDRVYRLAMSHDEAAEEIQNQAGKKFDPNIVNAFMELHIRSSLAQAIPA